MMNEWQAPPGQLGGMINYISIKRCAMFHQLELCRRLIQKPCAELILLIFHQVLLSGRRPANISNRSFRAGGRYELIPAGQIGENL